MSLCSSDCILCFQYLIFNTKVYNWQSYADIVRHIYGIIIFNFSIPLYGLMQRILYLIFFGLYCYVTVPLVNTLRYHKLVLIWRFVFVCSSIIEHEFYPWLLSRHLWLWQSCSALLLLPWIILYFIYACFCWRINFLNPTFIYQGNYITAKSQLSQTMVFQLFDVEQYSNSAAVKITNFKLSTST